MGGPCRLSRPFVQRAEDHNRAFHGETQQMEARRNEPESETVRPCGGIHTQTQTSGERRRRRRETKALSPSTQLENPESGTARSGPGDQYSFVRRQMYA